MMLLMESVSLVVVSHDIDGMARITERVVTLETGRVVADAPRTVEGVA